MVSPLGPLVVTRCVTPKTSRRIRFVQSTRGSGPYSLLFPRDSPEAVIIPRYEYPDSRPWRAKKCTEAHTYKESAGVKTDHPPALCLRYIVPAVLGRRQWVPGQAESPEMRQSIWCCMTRLRNATIYGDRPRSANERHRKFIVTLHFVSNRVPEVNEREDNERLSFVDVLPRSFSNVRSAVKRLIHPYITPSKPNGVLTPHCRV